MGLSVADFTQTFLPVATGAAQLAANAGLRGGFSALLQTFLGAARPGGAASDTSGPSLVDALPMPAEDPGDDSMAEALAAMCAGLGITPPTLTDPPGALSAEQANGLPAVVTAMDAAVSQAQLAALEEALAGLASNGAEAGPGATEGDLAAFAPPPEAATIAAPQLATATPAPAPLDAVAAAPAGLRAIVEATSPNSQPAPAPAPALTGTPAANEQPPDVPSPLLPVNGVVRSVGNAQLKDSSEGAGAGGPLTAAGANGTTSDDAPQPVSEAVALTNHPPAAETVEVVETPARPVADLPEAVRQVGRAAVERVREGGGTTRIQLDPAELGRITIDVRSEGGQVHLTVVAERPEAAQLLRDHAADLARIFQEQGLSLHVQVGGGGQERGQGEAQDSQPRRQRHGEPSFASIFGGEGPPSRTHSRVRAAYNPDGSHEYRI